MPESPAPIDRNRGDLLLICPCKYRELGHQWMSEFEEVSGEWLDALRNEFLRLAGHMRWVQKWDKHRFGLLIIWPKKKNLWGARGFP